MEYDTIIVGGGTAGAVLAGRLSARSANRVLLIEAGPDTREGETPPEILDSFPAYAYLDRRFLWNDLTVTTEIVPHNDPGRRPRERKYEQARVLGGGSAINGQLANRGAPGDYDEWVARGARGWAWEDVLPYFRKLEHDLDFDGPLHGKDGPIAIRRIFPDRWAPHAKGIAAGFRALGFDYLDDQNGAFRDGYYPVTIANLDDRRVFTSHAYLGPAVRRRPNLSVLTGTEVTGLRFDGRRCTGVTATVAGRTESIAAREVILSMGAIHTPAQLLRSGIGPAGQLRGLGIGVLADLAGVGKRMMDHPTVALASFVKPGARLAGLTRRHLLVGLRFSSGYPESPAGDMAVSVSTKTAWHAVGDQIASVTIWVNKTWSEAGEVTLRSPDPRAEPQVDFNLLHDRRDLERLTAAVRRLAKLFTLPEVQAVAADPFPASFSEKVRKIGNISARNAFLTAVLARFLDGPAPLRRFMIRTFINEGPELAQLLADDEAMEAFVRRAAVGVWHASCSCRMGAPDDPMAVTGPAGKVRGVDGLRIVDASLFPSIPRANTNLPTIMLAEKIADAILAGE